MSPTDLIPGDPSSRLLIIADHASCAVPAGVDLGVAPALLSTHIAVDIGAAELSRAIAARLRAPAVLGAVSRLVIDLNREPDAPGLVPVSSDGHAIPGNSKLSPDERAQRVRAYHEPYHATITQLIDALQPALIISVHSFTPRLAVRPDEPRPWPIGLLYNRDERAARRALDHLYQRGIVAGDNEPYSGRLLNYTMNRHAEARGLPYVNFELRQDEIGHPAGVSRWAAIVVETVAAILPAL